MIAVRTLKRVAALALMGAGGAFWYACSDRSSDPITGPSLSPQVNSRSVGPDLRAAIVAQRRHTDQLLEIPGVVGTAIGLMPDGRPGVQILLERAGIAGLPTALDGIPASVQVTGRLMALSDPTTRQRPAPLGFSVGHPAITAGTIGARVRDAAGRVFVLSNNHVLANANAATIGDAEYQPGTYDGGTAADQIATLSDFQAITFSGTANNTMDAAIALSSTDQLGNATPTDDAYGTPNAVIYGDANGDGVLDDRNALLGLNVQKYGRTTHLTHGQITGVNATVTICYEVVFIFCTKSARFVDQVIITPGTFSGGGDSGSLIVTDDGNKNPVALLFAGSATQTIANRIDLVLNRFHVSIDGTAPPPPTPVTDVAVTGVSSPSVVLGSTGNVTVTVKNVGNQDVASSFDVTLNDATESATLGTQSVAGLAAGASSTLTFSWTPGTAGSHSLVASHTLADDNAANNEKSATVAVNTPLTDVGVTSVTAPASAVQGNTVNVAVTVGNVGNQDVGSFDVTLQDATDNVTLGTQTVGGLAAGANSTLNFSWNTTGASLGGHTLVASHTLTDDNSANNQGSATVTVNPKLTDIAVTSITAPASVTQGNTANIGVTVRNAGDLDVSANFDVVLTDATHGGTIGTQTVNGLAVGASRTLNFPWNTTGVATGGHTLIARQQLADNNTTNDSRAIGITVNPANVNLHVGDLDATASTSGNTWSATVQVTVHTAAHVPLNGAVVRGTWSPSGLNSNQCTTGEGGGNGTCIMLYPSISRSRGSVSFTVNSVTRSGNTYQASANHDPDGSSNGTTITVRKP